MPDDNKKIDLSVVHHRPSLPGELIGGNYMFQFKAMFLIRKPTAATTFITDAQTGDAAKTTSDCQLNSRLLLDRQRRSKNEHQRYVACLRRGRVQIG